MLHAKNHVLHSNNTEELLTVRYVRSTLPFMLDKRLMCVWLAAHVYVYFASWHSPFGNAA